MKSAHTEGPTWLDQRWGPKGFLNGGTGTEFNIPFIYTRKAMAESKRRWETSNH